MMGRTHGASAAVAALGVAALADLPGTSVLALAAVAWVSAYLPDLDHPNATATRALPPLSWVACWALRNLSVRLGMPAHRGLTHSWPYAAAWGVLSGGVSAYWLSTYTATTVGVFAALGCLVGMLGDAATTQGLQHLLWPSRRQVHIPRWMRFRTGGVVEHALLGALVAAGCLLLPAVVG